MANSSVLPNNVSLADTTNSSYDMTGDREIEPFDLTLKYAELYLTPIIIFVGVVGNTLSFLVFIGTHLRRLSSSVYLAALAITDTGFLVQLFIAWLSHVRVNVIHTTGWCQAAVYLSYVCGFLSVWMVVSFTVERYIAVCYPLRRQDMCTARRAKIVVFSLSFFAVLAYTFAIWTTGVVKAPGSDFSVCDVLGGHLRLVDIVNNVDTVVTLLIPTLTIFGMNVRIVCRISYFYEQRSKMTPHNYRARMSSNSYDGESQNMTVTGNNELSGITPTSVVNTQCPSATSSARLVERNANPHNLHHSQLSQRNRAQIKITKLLLVVSTVFLILNLPSHAIRIYFFFLKMFGGTPTNAQMVTIHKLVKVFTLMFYANFSVNFFLYSLCGKNFRKALGRLCSRCRHGTGRMAQSKYRSPSWKLSRLGSARLGSDSTQPMTCGSTDNQMLVNKPLTSLS